MKKYKMNINGEKYEAKIVEYKGTEVIVEVNGMEYGVELEFDKPEKVQLVRSQKNTAPTPAVATPKKTNVVSAGAVVAPIPGLVLRVLVKEGDEVNAGDNILILEAMKMESEIASTASGTVKKILVSEGQSVQEGEALIEVG